MKVWIAARWVGEDAELVRREAIKVRRDMIKHHEQSPPEVKDSNIIFYSDRTPFYGTPNRGPQLDDIIDAALSDMRKAQIAADPDYGLYLKLKERYEGKNVRLRGRGRQVHP